MQRDTETAAWYMSCAAGTAYVEYHLPGQQPMLEKQRLTEANEAVVAVGQQGEDDGAIQYQVRVQVQLQYTEVRLMVCLL